MVFLLSPTGVALVRGIETELLPVQGEKQ